MDTNKIKKAIRILESYVRELEFGTPNVDQAELRAEYEAGAGLLALSRKYGIYYSKIRSLLVSAGAVIRRRGGSRVGSMKTKSISLLEKGLTAAEISRELKITRQAVYQHISGHAAYLPCRQKQKADMLIEKIVRELASGKSRTSVAKEFGLSYQAVVGALTRANMLHVVPKFRLHVVPKFRGRYSQQRLDRRNLIVDTLLSERRPKSSKELYRMLSERSEYTASSWASYMSRQRPDVLRLISRRGTKRALDERAQKVKQMLTENPNITRKEMSKRLGLQYGTFAAWLNNRLRRLGGNL